jgi:hypothetical protein
MDQNLIMDGWKMKFTMKFDHTNVIGPLTLIVI